MSSQTCKTQVPQKGKPVTLARSTFRSRFVYRHKKASLRRAGLSGDHSGQLWAVTEAMQTSELFQAQPLTPASTRLGDEPGCMFLPSHHSQHTADGCKLLLSEQACSSVPSH